jgi:hypothetical protein
LDAYDERFGAVEGELNINSDLLQFEFLNVVLVLQPSERFAIQRSSSSPDDLQMSAHGKHLVAKDVDRICDCLASLFFTESMNGKSGNLLNSIVPLIQVYHNDDSDAQFSMQISQRLCSELCLISQKYDIGLDFVLANSEAILFNFLASMLDSGRLEMFPSCNLERMRADAGEIAAQQALTLLDLFNDDFSEESRDTNRDDLGAMAGIQRRRRQKAESVWEMCQNLGAAVSRPHQSNHERSLLSEFTSTIGRILLDTDSDLSTRPQSFLNSMSLEKETSKCFKVLRGIISGLARHDKNHLSSFERTASFCISVVVTHILRIVQSLKYHDQTCTGGSQENEKDFRRARIAGLLSSFSELFVALVSWIIRESRHDCSEQWNFLLKQLRERVICPLFRRESIDLTVSFQHILMGSHMVLSKTDPTFMASRTMAGLPGCSKYLDELGGIIIRRSRQLLFSTSQNLSLQSALVDAVIKSDEAQEDRVARIVGVSFRSNGSSRPQVSFHNPLEKEMEGYFCAVEQELSRRPERIAHMKKAKLEFLQTFVSPKLNHSKASLVTKRRILRLISHILAPGIHQTATPDFAEMDTAILCSLVKGICCSVVKCLEKSVVDDDIVSTVFICATNLANATIACDVEQNNKSLIKWSQDVINASIDRSIDDLSSDELGATYFWVFFKWLENLGSSIVLESTSGTGNLSSFRTKLICKAGNEHKATEWSPVGVTLDVLYEETNLDGWDRLLNGFEKQLFPSTTENNANVINVYARKSANNNTSEGTLETWVPSPAVRRTAKEFMAEVVAVSFRVTA